MTAEQKSELIAKLQALQQQAQSAGLVAKDYGFGVLVICLPEYGEAEQLLLKAEAPKEAKSG